MSGLVEQFNMLFKKLHFYDQYLSNSLFVYLIKTNFEQFNRHLFYCT